MIDFFSNVILTKKDDEFRSSDSGIGRVEGRNGDDEIIITGDYAAQIEGDRGDDTLSGADVIYGGAGDDVIDNAQVAYGLDGIDDFGVGVVNAYGGAGDDNFSLVEGSYAVQGEGVGRYKFENTDGQHDKSGYAIVDASLSENGGVTEDSVGVTSAGPLVLLYIGVPLLDASGRAGLFSPVRILDSETGAPTKHLLISTVLDYEIIVVDYFISETSDRPAGTVFVEFAETIPENFQVDALSQSNITDDPVALPIADILANVGQSNEPLDPPTDDTDTSFNDLVTGTADEDTLEGFAGDDRLFGYNGDDRLEGDAGDDRVFGGAGDDILFGGAGDNRLDGGAGDDVVYARGETDTVWGDKGSDVIHADAGRTIISLEGIGDYAAEDEVDTVYGFDLGVDKVSIEGMTFDSASSTAFLSDNATIDGTNLSLDLGDGRTLKFIDVAEDEDEVEDFGYIFIL